MAIAFRAASAVAGAQGTAPVGLVIDKPSGTLDGDIMLAVIYYVSQVATPTCAGWTEITHYHLSVYYAVVVLWKRASSEGSNYTFTSSDGTKATGAIVSYSGCVGSGDPVDVYSSTGYTTTNTTVRAAGVTTTQDHDLLVFLGTAGSGGGPTNPSTPPSGFSERVDSNYDDDWMQIVVSDDEQATAGASGSKDATLTNSVGAAKHAFLVALTPSGGTKNTKALTTASAISVSLRRETQVSRIATSSATVSLRRFVTKAPFSTVSSTAISLLRTTKALHTVTPTVACSISRTTRRSFSAASTATAALRRRTGKALASISYTVIDLASGPIPYVLTARDWLVHTAGWSKPEMAEAVEFWGWIPRALSYPLALSATSAPTAVMQRVTGKVLSATSTVLSKIRKSVHHFLWAGSSSVAVTDSKAVSKSFSATSYTTSELLKTRAKLFSAVSDVAAFLSRSTGNNLSASVSVQAYITRRIRNVLSATSSVIATVTSLARYRSVRQPVVDRAIVVAPVADVYIHAPIAEVTR